MWHEICYGDIKPNKPTDATLIEKWKVKNVKALALIKSSVNNENYIHTKNASDAWTALSTLKCLFDTQP